MKGRNTRTAPAEKNRPARLDAKKKYKAKTTRKIAMLYLAEVARANATPEQMANTPSFLDSQSEAKNMPTIMNRVATPCCQAAWLAIGKNAVPTENNSVAASGTGVVLAARK